MVVRCSQSRLPNNLITVEPAQVELMYVQWLRVRAPLPDCYLVFQRFLKRYKAADTLCLICVNWNKFPLFYYLLVLLTAQLHSLSFKILLAQFFSGRPYLGWIANQKILRLLNDPWHAEPLYVVHTTSTVHWDNANLTISDHGVQQQMKYMFFN